MSVYLFPVLMFVFVGWIAVRELPGVRRRWKLEKRIGQIGVDQVCGQVEIITAAVLSERKR